MANDISPPAHARPDEAAPHDPALTPAWAVIDLAVGPAVALGLARLAYALLLPAMPTDLHWSFGESGSLNTANAAGYLIGALQVSESVAGTLS